MTTTPLAILSQALQNVTTAQPTVQAGLTFVMDPHSKTRVSFPPDILSSTPRGNGTTVLGDEHGDPTAWLSIRLVSIFCVLLGIVLLTVASYYIHRKYCKPKNTEHLKYHNTTLML